MASSTHKQLPNLGGATAAPPPTPSTQTNLLSTSDAADVLSNLLHRLPPTLSALPTRASSRAISPPIISLSDQNHTDILSSSSQLGFFQLTNHFIPPQLAFSAESDSLSLFNLSRDQKELFFPKNWPLGYDGDDDGDGIGESFCLDSSCSADSTELNISYLREFTREMEKVGLDVIESLCNAVGFENPFREDPTRACSLMWISEGGSKGSKPGMPNQVYPYIIGLQYQIRCRKYSLLADSGWVSVSPQVDSVLVTVGDIAQVWSNGKLKKVRGKAVAMSSLEDEKNSRTITISLLLSLPTDNTVSPLLPRAVVPGIGNQKNDDEEEVEKPTDNSTTEKPMFNSFAFEDYAWRVYHERVLFKDPLHRYRI